MQPERTDLAPPKDDPFTTEDLKQYDGTDSSKPILVAVKGEPYALFFPMNFASQSHPFQPLPPSTHNDLHRPLTPPNFM